MNEVVCVTLTGSDLGSIFQHTHSGVIIHLHTTLVSEAVEKHVAIWQDLKQKITSQQKIFIHNTLYMKASTCQVSFYSLGQLPLARLASTRYVSFHSLGQLPLTTLAFTRQVKPQLGEEKLGETSTHQVSLYRLAFTHQISFQSQGQLSLAKLAFN